MSGDEPEVLRRAREMAEQAGGATGRFDAARRALHEPINLAKMPHFPSEEARATGRVESEVASLVALGEELRDALRASARGERRSRTAIIVLTVVLVILTGAILALTGVLVFRPPG